MQKQKEEVLLLSSSCSTACTQLHTPPVKNHSEIPLKKFKRIYLELLSADDDNWMDVMYSYEDKFQNLISEITKIKDQHMDFIYHQKIIGSLGIQNQERHQELIQIAKLAMNQDYSKIKCSEMNALNEHVQKIRNSNKKIKTAKEIEQMIDEGLIEKIKGSLKKYFNSGFVNNNFYSQPIVKKQQENAEDPRDRYRNRDRLNRGDQNSRNNEISNKKPTNGQPTSKIFTNDLKQKKIKEIQKDIDDRFNIVLKVIRIIKQFNIKNTRKIQFKAGDETGVVDCVITYTPLVQEGNVISISQCRLYDFRGSKQIQTIKSSQILEEKLQIKINDRFNFSQRKKMVKNQKIVSFIRVSKEEKGANLEPKKYLKQDQQRFVDRRDRGMRNNREEQQDNESFRRKMKAYDFEQQDYQRSKEKEEFMKDASRQRESQNQLKKHNSSHSSHCSEFDLEENEGEEEDNDINGKSKWSKIEDIEPGDSGLNIIASIFEIKPAIKVSPGHIFCILGDETAIVNAELPSHYDFLKEGVVVEFEEVDADVDSNDKHIRIVLGEGRCKKTAMRINKINQENNKSEVDYEEEQEEPVIHKKESFKKNKFEDF